MYKFFKKVLVLIAGFEIFILASMGAALYIQHAPSMQEAKLQAMYRRIMAQTGQVQDRLPLFIVHSDIQNAYNDGEKIVIYQGLIDVSNDDEIALVMGHEIAHYMLGHLNEYPPFIDGSEEAGMGINDAISVLEGNADKMGAVYMMKAGYNICKGREIYKFWREENGNFIGMDHPDYSYRYDELNIGCE